MRKTTKGALAVGAGVALLLGGAGTMAAWSTSKTIDSATSVTTGNLDMTTTTPGTWAWGDSTCTTPGAAIADVTTVALVPGDCVIYTQALSVTAKGDNLVAQATISGTPTYSGTATPTDFTVTTTSAFPTPPTGLTSTGSGSAIVWKFDAASVASTHSITATGKAQVAIKFNDSATGSKGAKTFSVTGMSVLLKQTAPASA